METPSPTPARPSNAFEVFTTKVPDYATAWQHATESLTLACALDIKTRHLAYLAVLAAQRLESGVPFHVRSAKRAGASREEVISAVLLGLQPAGHGVTACLPAALAAYDNDPAARPQAPADLPAPQDPQTPQAPQDPQTPQDPLAPRNSPALTAAPRRSPRSGGGSR